jgi:hypothetical protein
MTPYRQRATRADRRTINVVQRRGHLSYCYGACCCGRTDYGCAAALAPPPEPAVFTFDSTENP